MRPSPTRLHGGISAEPIPAQLGYQPTKDGLRLAWQVTIDDAEDGHLWEATVDAASGDLLRKNDWSSHAKTPNPVNDGSSYRVFEFPKQDPNDGDAHARDQPGRRVRVAVRLARHQRRRRS